MGRICVNFCHSLVTPGAVTFIYWEKMLLQVPLLKLGLHFGVYRGN